MTAENISGAGELEPVAASAAELLRLNDAKWKELDALAEYQLMSLMDGPAYRATQIKMAQVIQALPEEIEKLRSRGVSVNEDISHRADYLAQSADKGLASLQQGGSGFMISTLNSLLGDAPDSPSVLERLAVQSEQLA